MKIIYRFYFGFNYIKFIITHKAHTNVTYFSFQELKWRGMHNYFQKESDTAYVTYTVSLIRVLSVIFDSENGACPLSA